MHLADSSEPGFRVKIVLLDQTQYFCGQLENEWSLIGASDTSFISFCHFVARERERDGIVAPIQLCLSITKDSFAPPTLCFSYFHHHCTQEKTLR